MKKLLFFFFLAKGLLAWQPVLDANVKVTSYKFYQSEIRFTIYSFPNRFISISEHCIVKTRYGYTSRDCYAWDLYEAISDGRMNKRLYDRDIRHVKTRKELGFAICMEADGYVDTEQNEFSLQSGHTDLEDFCVFHDSSKVTILSIVNYYLSNTKIKGLE